MCKISNFILCKIRQDGKAHTEHVICHAFMFGLNLIRVPFSVHTMEELKLTGNHLKGSRPLLTFSTNFDKEPRWMLMKELITQVCIISIFVNRENLVAAI